MSPSPSSQGRTVVTDGRLRGLGRGGSTCGIIDQVGTDQEIHANVLIRHYPLEEIRPPGGEPADPTFDGVAVAAYFAHRELAAPTVVPKRRQGRDLPLGIGLPPEAQTAL